MLDVAPTLTVSRTEAHIRAVECRTLIRAVEELRMVLEHVEGRPVRGGDEVSADGDQAAEEWAPTGGAAGSGAEPPAWISDILENFIFVAEEGPSAGADGDEEDFNLIPGLRQALHDAGIDSTMAEPAGAAEGASLCEDMAAAAASSRPQRERLLTWLRSAKAPPTHMVSPSGQLQVPFVGLGRGGH